MIQDKRYVDDVQDANSDMQELELARDETEELLGRFGFDIKEWLSNHPVIGHVKESNKILGTRWNAVKDYLSPSIGKKELEHILTKRNVLSAIAGVWDPLGTLCGVQMKGKLIFQSIVRMKVGWDESVSDEELIIKWNDWLNDLSDCYNIKIDRSILPSDRMTGPLSCILVGFSDGSSVAHGCTLYLRWADESEENVEVKFVGAKGKVNPIKGTTTPRSEMCGAFLLYPIIS